MKSGNRLGLAAVVCIALTFAPPYGGWKAPVNTVLVVTGCVLGYYAGLRGNRWWWVVPGVTLVLLCLMLWVVWRTM